MNAKPATQPQDAATVAGTVKGMEWDFDETIRGTVKGMPVHLDLEALDASIEQAAGPQRIPPEDGTFNAKSPFNPSEGETVKRLRPVEGFGTVRPVRKEASPAPSGLGVCITAALDSLAGDLEAQDARSVGAIRDGFSALASQNPELIARIVEQVVEESSRRRDDENADAAAAPAPDDDLIADRSPIADLLYQRCE